MMDEDLAVVVRAHHAKAARRTARRQDREAAGRLSERVVIDAEELTLDPAGFFVYLLFERGATEPFYVGQSSNIFARIGVHYSVHGSRLAAVKVIRCDTRAHMNRTEMALIKRYRPAANIVGCR